MGDQNLTEKWKELVEDQELPAIAKMSHKEIASVMLENTESQLKKDGWLNEADANVTGSYDNVAAGTKDSGLVDPGPVVMGIVRRAVPQLMGFSTMGVQPLTQPTGQVFCLRSIYGKDPRTADANGNEAFHPNRAPRGQHSGIGATPGFTASELEVNTTYNVGDYFTFEFEDKLTGIRWYQVLEEITTTEDLESDMEGFIQNASIAEISEGMAASIAELQEGFADSTDNAWNEMSFRIDKQTVEAKARQLKAQYSIELAQDLQAVHGIDADAELNAILANEILAEIDREGIITINSQAQVGKTGMTGNGQTPGVFDLSDDVDNRGARWAGEAYKSLLIQIEKEANEIGRQTGRGTGNFLIASRNVVSLLAQTGVMVGPAAHGMQDGSLNTDTNQGVFAGRLAGRFNVFIDQFANFDYFTVGYKGDTEMEAGVYYSPYVPLFPLRSNDSRNFQPVLGLKTRYAMSINPFVEPEDSQIFSNSLARGIGKNQFYRRVFVKNV